MGSSLSPILFLPQRDNTSVHVRHGWTHYSGFMVMVLNGCLKFKMNEMTSIVQPVQLLNVEKRQASNDAAATKIEV